MLAQCLRVVEEKEHRSSLWFLRGVLAERTRRYPLALHAYQTALTLTKNPERQASIHNKIGMILKFQRRWEEAFERHQKALNLTKDPEKQAIMHHNIGFVLRGQGKRDEALKRYQKALTLTKNFEKQAIFHNGIGIILHSQGRWKEALKQYQKALDLTKNSEQQAISHNGIGGILRSQGRWEEALKRYQKALDLTKDSEQQATCHNNIGRILKSQGRWEEALKQYQKALDLTKNPNKRATYHNNIGIILHSQGRWKEALKQYQKALDLTKDSEQQATCHNNIGRILKSQGRWEEALKRYQKALDLTKNPEKKAIMHNNIGDVLKSDEALKRYQKALSLTKDPEEKATVHNNIGSVLYLQGRREEALQWYQKALDLTKNPGKNATMHANIGLLLFGQARYADAVVHLEWGLLLLSAFQRKRPKRSLRLLMHNKKASLVGVLLEAYARLWEKEGVSQAEREKWQKRFVLQWEAGRARDFLESRLKKQRSLGQEEVLTVRCPQGSQDCLAKRAVSCLQRTEMSLGGAGWSLGSCATLPSLSLSAAQATETTCLKTLESLASMSIDSSAPTSQKTLTEAQKDEAKRRAEVIQAHCRWLGALYEGDSVYHALHYPTMRTWEDFTGTLSAGQVWVGYHFPNVTTLPKNLRGRFRDRGFVVMLLPTTSKSAKPSWELVIRALPQAKGLLEQVQRFLQPLREDGWQAQAGFHPALADCLALSYRSQSTHQTCALEPLASCKDERACRELGFRNRLRKRYGCSLARSRWPSVAGCLRDVMKGVQPKATSFCELSFMGKDSEKRWRGRHEAFLEEVWRRRWDAWLGYALYQQLWRPVEEELAKRAVRIGQVFRLTLPETLHGLPLEVLVRKPPSADAGFERGHLHFFRAVSWKKLAFLGEKKRFLYSLSAGRGQEWRQRNRKPEKTLWLVGNPAEGNWPEQQPVCREPQHARKPKSSATSRPSSRLVQQRQALRRKRASYAGSAGAFDGIEALLERARGAKQAMVWDLWGQRLTSSEQGEAMNKGCLEGKVSVGRCLKEGLGRFGWKYRHLMWLVHGLLPREKGLPACMQGPPKEWLAEPALLWQRKEVKEDEVKECFRPKEGFSATKQKRKKHPLDLLGAREVLGLRLHQEQTIWLGACSTGLGDTRLGGEGAYSFARNLLLAGAGRVQMTLWNVPIGGLLKLFEGLFPSLESRKSASEALFLAQQKLRQENPHPSEWAGYVLFVP